MLASGPPDSSEARVARDCQLVESIYANRPAIISNHEGSMINFRCEQVNAKCTLWVPGRDAKISAFCPSNWRAVR